MKCTKHWKFRVWYAKTIAIDPKNPDIFTSLDYFSSTLTELHRIDDEKKEKKFGNTETRKQMKCIYQQLATTGDVTIQYAWQYGLKTVSTHMHTHTYRAQHSAISRGIICSFRIYYIDPIAIFRCSANRSVSNSIILALVCYPVGIDAQTSCVDLCSSPNAFDLTLSLLLISISVSFYSLLLGFSHRTSTWTIAILSCSFERIIIFRHWMCASLVFSLSLSVSLALLAHHHNAETFITHSVDRLSAT